MNPAPLDSCLVRLAHTFASLARHEPFQKDGDRELFGLRREIFNSIASVSRHVTDRSMRQLPIYVVIQPAEARQVLARPDIDRKFVRHRRHSLD